jgi:chromosomal replication initiator protein
VDNLSIDASVWDYEVFWNEAVAQLRSEITEQEFQTWFSGMSYAGAHDSQVRLNVPSSFYRDQVDQRYRSKLEESLFDLSGQHLQVTFEIRRTNGTATVLPVDTEILPPPAQASPIREERPRHAQLNPEYRFSRFVEGDGNSFALNAAIAIAKKPGRTYNPCLIYGGVGLGKTHLLQAIGNDVYQEYRDLKVVYVTVETFTNEFIQSIKDKTGHRFKNRYRSADVLLIDDVQFLQGKTETQQELFHTFNALYDANKQMVFTSDRPVSELKSLPDRLINRFERGLNIDLQPPNYETRIAILTQKIDESGVSVPTDAIELISQNIQSNVRDLEKALTKLTAYSNLVNRTITLDIASRELSEFFSTPANVSLDTIQRVTAEYFGLSQTELKGKKRTRAIAFPRQVAMFIARDITELSTTEIGLEFGGRDHTTVMHGCQRVAERKRADPTLDPIISHLTRTITQRSR